MIRRFLQRLWLEEGGWARIWYGLATAMVVAGGGLIYHQATNQGSPASVHVWVTTSGNDGTCVRDNQSLPCATFDKAFDVAQAGDAIEVAAGTYTGDQIVTDVQKAVTIQAATGAQPRVTGQLQFQCTTGVTVNNIDAKNLIVESGNDNLTVNGGEYGNGTYTFDNEDDPIGLGGTTACSTGTQTNNLVLDGFYVHDYFWQQDPGNAHTDCLQFGGNLDGVIIRNATFARCAESFIGAFPDAGDINDVLIEDTTFTDISEVGKGTFYAAQWGCPGHPDTFTNTTIQNTTWTPNALGLDGVGISLRTDCPQMTVQNNHFQYGPSQDACDSWNATWSNTITWTGNTFDDTDGCVAP